MPRRLSSCKGRADELRAAGRSNPQSTINGRLIKWRQARGMRTITFADPGGYIWEIAQDLS